MMVVSSGLSRHSTSDPAPVYLEIERATMPVCERDDSGLHSCGARELESSCHKRRVMAFSTYSPRQMQILTKDNVSPNPTDDIHTENFMFTVTPNPFGFHVLDKLPIGSKLNSGHFTPNILAPFE
jgi:hypothetical protein